MATIKMRYLIEPRDVIRDFIRDVIVIMLC